MEAPARHQRRLASRLLALGLLRLGRPLAPNPDLTDAGDLGRRGLPILRGRSRRRGRTAEAPAAGHEHGAGPGGGGGAAAAPATAGLAGEQAGRRRELLPPWAG